MRWLSPARAYKSRCPSPCDLLCIAGPRSPSHPCPSSCSRGTKSTAAPCLPAARRPTAPLASTPAPPSPLHLAPHAISRTQGSSAAAKPSVQASSAPSITPIAGRPDPSSCIVLVMPSAAVTNRTSPLLVPGWSRPLPSFPASIPAAMIHLHRGKAVKRNPLVVPFLFPRFPKPIVP